jgi:hypothetical protein
MDIDLASGIQRLGWSQEQVATALPLPESRSLRQHLPPAGALQPASAPRAIRAAIPVLRHMPPAGRKAWLTRATQGLAAGIDAGPDPALVAIPDRLPQGGLRGPGQHRPSSAACRTRRRPCRHG